MYPHINIQKVKENFNNLGIQIQNEDGSYKCWFDILEEVSEVWKSIN